MNPELTYVALRPRDQNQPAPNVVVIAKNRIEAVHDILGPVDIIAEFLGNIQLPFLQH